MDDGPTPRLRRIERRIEEQLRELADMGELSNVPGEGAPLVDDDPDAGDRWAARHVAKNANLTPEFVELRREIADRRDRLVRRLRRASRRGSPTEPRCWATCPPSGSSMRLARPTDFDLRVESELRSAVGELNALVARHNLKVPLGLQIPPLTLELLRERS